MEDGGRVDYAVDRREVIFRLMFIAVYGVVRTARVLEVVSRRHDELDGWRRGTEEDAKSSRFELAQELRYGKLER